MQLVGFCILLCSCGGATSAGPARDGDPSPTGSDAGADSAIDHGGPLDAICDGVAGLTGRKVVDSLGTPRAATFSRFIYPPGPPALGNAMPLTLQLHYESGNVRCTPATPDAPDTPNPGVRPATVAVDVKVDFVTGDGLFAESFVATFKTSSPDSTMLQWEGNVPVSEIKGSYRAMGESDGTKDTPVKFFGLYEADFPAASGGGVVHGEAFGHYDFDESNSKATP